MSRALLWPLLCLYALFLRWCIWDTRTYLAACKRDGLTDSLSLREFNAEIDRDLVRLARVHALIKPIHRTADRRPT